MTCFVKPALYLHISTMENPLYFLGSAFSIGDPYKMNVIHLGLQASYMLGSDFWLCHDCTFCRLPIGHRLLEIISCTTLAIIWHCTHCNGVLTGAEAPPINESVGTPLANVITFNSWLVITAFDNFVVSDIRGNVIICPFSRGLSKSSYIADFPTPGLVKYHLVLDSWTKQQVQKTDSKVQSLHHLLGSLFEVKQEKDL